MDDTPPSTKPNTARLPTSGAAWLLQGAVVSGKMRVQMAGGGADGKLQQALTVSAPWLDARWNAIEAAVRHIDTEARDLVLMDHATKAGSAFATHSRAAFAATVSEQEHSTPTRVAMYELLGEVRDHDGDAEWMYVLQKAQAAASSSARLNSPDSGDERPVQSRADLDRALDLWATGADSEMLALLQPFDETPTDAPSLAHFLNRRLEAARSR